MRSTGEVMGIDQNFGLAFAKAQMATGVPLPLEGTVLLTVADRDKPKILSIARKFKELGFDLMATKGTAAYLQENDIKVESVAKIGKGRPDINDHIKNGNIQFVVNRPQGKGSKFDEYKMRRQALLRNVAIATTVQGALAAAEGIEKLRNKELDVKPLQDYHLEI